MRSPRAVRNWFSTHEILSDGRDLSRDLKYLSMSATDSKNNSESSGVGGTPPAGRERSSALA